MRRLLYLLAVPAMLLLLAAPVRAAQVQFTGTLSITVGTLPTIPIQGSGVAEVALGQGGAVPTGAFATVNIPPGAFATALTAPVPNAFPIIQLVLAGPGKVGSLSNSAIAVSAGAGCTSPHPNVSCPGGSLAGFGGLDGSAFVGIFSTHTAGSGTGPVANLSVPLGVVGGGSTVMTTGQGIQVTVSGAGWTTGQAMIVAPTTTTTFHTAGSGTAMQTGVQTTVATTGTRTSDPARGTVDGEPALTGEGLTLVSPVQVFNTATNEFSPTIARMAIRFTPEPTGTVLSLAAFGVVAGLFGLRRLRR